MAKQTVTFICNNCDYRSLKWIGSCPECSEWDCFTEHQLTNAKNNNQKSPLKNITLSHLNDLASTIEKPRMMSGIGEWDRVMGGGVMSGSLIVLTGDPGIGKSTLLLQVASALASTHQVLYFSTEESLHQVSLRARRLNLIQSSLLFSDQASLDEIIAIALDKQPNIIVVDSIQNCYFTDSQSLPGSINQLREATFRLMRLAKDNDITVILTGHITKEGVIAGPKALEHMVDAVFYLQGENNWHARVLRAVKNRFGTINELGFFEMHQDGLGEIPDINAHLFDNSSNAPGAALVSIMEGTRPLLLELQALTIESKIGIPQRVISGVDHKQVVLIAAILQKYLHIPLSSHDIFFKVSGGVSNKETVTDLGIALALLSSYFQLPLPPKTLIVGEISLTGQIKPVNYVDAFIKEAEKFGIQHLVIADQQKISKTSCKTHRFKQIYELPNLFEMKK